MVSGSRGLKACPVFAAQVVALAHARHWQVYVGDAGGVDNYVMQACHAAGLPHTIFACELLGYPRHSTPSATIVYSPEGDLKTCWAIRDKYMVEQALALPVRGFMALWDGESRGTRLTADYAKAKGLAGLLIGPQGYKEIWHGD